MVVSSNQPTMCLSCIVSEIFNVERRAFEILVKSHSPWEFMHDLYSPSLVIWTFRSREWKVHRENFRSSGTFVPWNIRCLELSPHGTFVPVELSLHENEYSKNFRSKRQKAL